MMEDVLAEIEAAAMEGAAPAPEGSMEDLMAFAAEMEGLNEELKDLKAQVKAAQERYDYLREKIIPEEMRNLGMIDTQGKGSFTTASGSTIYITNDLYAYVRKDDQPKLFEWLRGRGHQDLIKETVHPGTLKAFAKECVSEGEELPEFIQTSPVTKAAIRRSK